MEFAIFKSENPDTSGFFIYNLNEYHNINNIACIVVSDRDHGLWSALKKQSKTKQMCMCKTLRKKFTNQI